MVASRSGETGLGWDLAAAGLGRHCGHCGTRPTLRRAELTGMPRRKKRRKKRRGEEEEGGGEEEEEEEKRRGRGGGEEKRRKKRRDEEEERRPLGTYKIR